MASYLDAFTAFLRLAQQHRMDVTMPSASTLKDVYIEELRDLWSANDQMQRVMQSLSDKASDAKLKELLARSVSIRRC